MVSPTKNPQLATKKIIFKCKLEDWPIHLNPEQFSSTISGGVMALVRQPKSAGFRPKPRYDIFIDQLSKC